MGSCDLVEVSSRISREMTIWTPLHFKLTRVINQKTFEVARSDTPVSDTQFWAEAIGGNTLSDRMKAKVYLQLHRSNGCQDFVLDFAKSLKYLNDSGVSLSYEGGEVVDMFVVTTTEFDVSDIPCHRVLELVDPISNTRVPHVHTYEVLDRLIEAGEDICSRFGLQQPERSFVPDYMRQYDLESYKTKLPHQWLAAVVQTRGTDTTDRIMVHLDVCGAAYDDTGFRRVDESLVSLRVFRSPEYDLIYIPQTRVSTIEDPSHCLHLSQRLRPAYVNGTATRVILPTLSFRHLRGLRALRPLMVTALEMYIDRGLNGNPPPACVSSASLCNLRNRIMLNLPADTAVFLRDTGTQLDGWRGRTQGVVINAFDRSCLPILLEGESRPVAVGTKCIGLTNQKQYSSALELLLRSELW